MYCFVSEVKRAIFFFLLLVPGSEKYNDLLKSLVTLPQFVLTHSRFLNIANATLLLKMSTEE